MVCRVSSEKAAVWFPAEKANVCDLDAPCCDAECDLPSWTNPFGVSTGACAGRCSRVLVVENGQIVEDGNPAELARQSNSRYRTLLEAEESVREGLWSSGSWRRLRLEDGRLNEELQRVTV